MDVFQSAVSEFRTGQGLAVATPAPIVAEPFCRGHNLLKGVTVKAIDGTIYVGGPHVSEANGYRIDTGESVFIPCDKLSSVYVIGVNVNYAWVAG